MNCRNNLNIKHYTTVRSEWPRKYYTSYIQNKYRILYLKKNLKSFTTMLKGSKGSVTLLLVHRSAECFRAKEWEPKNRCIHIFFLSSWGNLVSRLSFIRLSNDKGGAEERAWKQGCQSTSFSRTTFLKELCNNAMNVLTSNRTNAFYVHYL